MNKHLYRIVFNARRGQLMVVAETASGDGKSAAGGQPGQRPAKPYRATQRALTCSLFAALGLAFGTAHAQIVAYRSAPANQQPTILNAGNGVPLINIQTPSSAGVSRNSYSQFDVQSAGAILNNSRNATQTQLGGWVQGNPWLAAGSARLVLNQISSANPSLLRGYVEVAGSPAQVVVANPAGVTCAGCGFINANRVTLTTGTPIVNGGNLDGYRVEGGTLRVDGTGLDASQVTQTDLIARAVEINAGLWANTLRITTGANQIDAEHTLAKPIAGTGPAPAFALDVAQLGGMYAGKIALVGTEAGVGVRNAGHVGASAGEVIVTADGRLHNSGRITSLAQTQIDTGDGIDNRGTIYAQGDATLSTRGHLDNAGTIAAGGNTAIFATGVGGRISASAGSLLAAGLQPDGGLSGSARLDLRASAQIAVHGQAVASGDQSLRANALDLSDSQMRADNLTLTATSGNLDARRSVLSATGTLSATAAQRLLHDNARSDAQQLQLAARDISNVHGELIQTGSGDTSIALAGAFNNSQGRLASNSRNLGLAASAIDNSDGAIIHAGSGTLSLSTVTLAGARGNLGSNGRLDLVAQSVTLDGASTVANNLYIETGTLSNRGGQISQTGSGDTTIKATERFDNSGGTLTSSGHTTLTLGVFDNHAGVIGAGGDIRVAAQSVRNIQGQISAGQTLQIAARSSIDNSQGLLAATGKVGLNSDGIDNSRGMIASVHDQVVADANGGTLSNARGRIEAAQALTVAGTGMSNVDGVITSGQTLQLDSRRHAFDNTGGTLAASAALDLQSGALTNDGGLIQAGDVLTIDTVGQTLSNRDSGANGGILGQGTVALTTGGFDNSAGVVSAQGDIRVAAQSLHNAQGQISAGQMLQIAANQRIDNSQGVLAANGKFSLNSNGIDNSRGTIASVHDQVAADANGGTLSNARGRIEAAQALTVAGTGMSNADGVITSGQTLQLDSRRHAFDNSRGTLAASAALDLQSGALTNDGGLIQAGDVLTIDTAGQALSNRNSGVNGGILGQSTVTMSTGDLDNSAGFLGAKGQVGIASDAITNSAGGKLGSEQGIALIANHLDNRGGQLQSLDSTRLQVSGAIDNAGGLIGSGRSLSLEADRVINSDTGASGASGIEGRSLSIAAHWIDNRRGALRANETLTLKSGGAIDNGDGLISSADTLQILDPDATALSNSTGKTLAVTNSGGTLIADRRLTVDSASLSGDGALLSQGDLAVKVLADFTHTGQFSANGNASLETSGTVTNRTALQARKRLDVKAADLDNEASGEIIATTLQLSTTGSHSLSNRGLIDGGDTFVASSTLNNLGTGRIYGDHLAIDATTLTNDAENANGRNAAPVIAARDRLDIGANLIVNREHALLFSAGDQAIGGALDASHYASGQAGTLNNASATIEALGKLAINAGQINNTNAHFSTHVVALGSESITEYQGKGAANRYLPGTAGVYIHNDESDQLMTPEGDYESWLSYNYTRNASETQVLTSDPGKILAGGAMQLTANTLLNSDSQIIAGGTLTAAIGTLNNSETPGQRTVSDAGTVTSYWRNHRKGRDNTGSSVATYNPPDTIVSIALGSTVYQQNTASSSSGATPATLAIGQMSQSAVGAMAHSASVGTGQAVAQIAQVSPASGQAVAQTTRVSPGNALSISQTTQVNANLGAGQAVARLTEVPALVVGGSGPTMVIRSVTPNIVLPNNSLFRTSSSPTTHYLVETDPQFASKRQWLSSDYLLSALASDPAATQKRLGDGFYEQRLIREQIAQLTGRRFLDGYASDEAQYQALMDAGITYAKTWQLIPGVALSAAQIAQLTTDIVWLVEKDVSLPNGLTAKALVPQIYARVRDGDLAPSGALIAANDIDLKLTGDLTNSGTIAGRQIVALSAENINNLGGRISGQNTLAAARNDLTNLGGTLQAENRLIASAGHDLTVASTTRTQENAQGRRTSIDRIAGLYVTGSQGMLVASAGNDLTLLAAAIANAAAAGATDSTTASTTLIAGNDLTLGTVSEANSNRVVWDGKNTRSDSRRREIGSSIQSAGDLSLRAGHDLIAKAASVTSDRGALDVRAGNDLAISAGAAQETVDEAHRHSESGFLSRKTLSTRDTLDATSALASTFSGNTTALGAGRNIRVKGSNVVATGDSTLFAGNDIAIEAASATRTETHFRDVKQSGVFGSGGVGFTIGSLQQSTDQQTTATGSAPSTIGSTDGNVLLQAGHGYRQVGSDVIAPQGDIDIAAQSIDIVEARATSRRSFESKARQSGLTIALSNPVITAVQTAQQMKDAASDTSDSRMTALAAASTALSFNNAYNAVKAGQGATIEGKSNQMPVTNDQGQVIDSRDASAGERAGGINLSVSVGSSSSSSKTTQSSDRAAGSRLAAGKDIRLSASGAGKNSDLTVQGSDVSAGNNIALKADDEIRLLAAKNTADQHSSNESSSASIGISYGSNGLLFNIGASRGRGNAEGSDATWSNTRLNAGDTLSLESGGNTALRGAVARGEQVVARVGASGHGDLSIESLQDTSSYDSQQRDAGFSLSIGMGKISGSASSSRSKISSDYASVTEQSGIKAGDGGFQVDVKGDTALKGAVIASTQAAVEQNRNAFSTAGTLSTSDLHNHAEFDAQSSSVNLGSGISFDGQLKPGGTSAGFGDDSGAAKNTTQSGISGIAGNLAVRSGDPETGIKKIFDAETVQKEIDAQTKITQQFGQLAAKAVGDFATSKRTEAANLRAQARNEKDPERIRLLEAQASTLETNWGDQGTLRLAAHALIGGLTGGLSGAAGAAAGTLSSPLVADKLMAAGIDGPLATTLIALASTASGAVIGGSVGAGTALNEVANNYIYHYKGKIIAYDKNDNDKIIELSDKDLSKLAAQNPEILTQVISGIDVQAAPILVLDSSSNLMTDSWIQDIGSPADRSQIAKETDMGYKNLTNQKTRIYVQTGMDNTRSDADQSAIALGRVLGRTVGYINNGTEGLTGDVGEYLPDTVSKKDVLNEYTLRTLDSKGPTLIVTHSAGNEDARKALLVGALYGHQYDNLNFLSVGSPVSDSALQAAIGQSGARYLGQVNDWKDPITYSKAAGVVSVGTFLGGLLGGLGYGAAQGCTVGASSGPLGCIFAGVAGGAAGGAVGAMPAVAGLLSLKYYHPFEQYIAKPQTQSILFDWLKANSPEGL